MQKASYPSIDIGEIIFIKYYINWLLLPYNLINTQDFPPPAAAAAMATSQNLHFIPSPQLFKRQNDHIFYRQQQLLVSQSVLC